MVENSPDKGMGMSRDIERCWEMTRDGEGCQKISIDHRWQEMSKDVLKISQDVKRHQKMTRNVMRDKIFIMTMFSEYIWILWNNILMMHTFATLCTLCLFYLVDHQINLFRNRVGPGFCDQMLVVKRRKNVPKSFFFARKYKLILQGLGVAQAALTECWPWKAGKG